MHDDIFVVIVGFKVGEANSTYYKKLEVSGADDPKIAKAMVKALEVSDFVSVRYVK